VGGSLATAGAGYQALLRNPLAEPYLLGISNGAAVGTMIALVFFGANEWTRPLLAFTGALLATLAVYRLARGRAGATPERLILAGVIVTTFLSSVIVFVTTLMDATRIRSFTFWLLGDLSGTSKAMLPVTIIIAIAGALTLTLNARSLNLLMLGERDAFDLGVEVGRVRVVVFLVASLLVGSSVAASGSVGYVGLVVPHLARLSLGSDNRISIPAAALGGAVFVIVADTIARTVIAPRELPVGAITALIGAPLFIYLLKRA
jgi:iron complex transport system permease protein